MAPPVIAKWSHRRLQMLYYVRRTQLCGELTAPLKCACVHVIRGSLLYSFVIMVPNCDDCLSIERDSTARDVCRGATLQTRQGFRFSG